MQNIESPAGAVAMVLGGSAEAGLTWEPNVSVGLEREPKLTTIYNVGAGLREKCRHCAALFRLCAANEAETRHPGVSTRIAAAMEDCIVSALANVDEAVALAAPKMKVSEAALKAALHLEAADLRPGVDAERARSRHRAQRGRVPVQERRHREAGRRRFPRVVVAGPARLPVTHSKPVYVLRPRPSRRVATRWRGFSGHPTRCHQPRMRVIH